MVAVEYHDEYHSADRTSNDIVLTLCPYLLRPITELPIAEVSDEHIIPLALGGSDQFVLRADRNANSHFGETVDSDLIHDPMLRFVAATQGVRSRSGEVSATLSGTVVETGDQMEATFGKDGLKSRRIKDGHRKDPLFGELTNIVGFDSQFQGAIDILARSEKYKARLAAGQHRTIENPLVKLDIQSDSLKISKGLAKIAYPMTCRTLGDGFVRSNDAISYRSAILATDWLTFDESGLRFLGGAELPFVVLPNLSVYEHLVACYCLGSIILTTVSLFGGIAVSTFALSSYADQMPALNGTVVINDSRARRMTETRLQDAVPLAEMVQKMIAFRQSQTENGTNYNVS